MAFTIAPNAMLEIIVNVDGDLIVIIGVIDLMGCLALVERHTHQLIVDATGFYSFQLLFDFKYCFK